MLLHWRQNAEKITLRKKFSQIGETTKRTVVKETNLLNKEKKKEKSEKKLSDYFDYIEK